MLRAWSARREVFASYGEPGRISRSIPDHKPRGLGAGVPDVFGEQIKLSPSRPKFEGVIFISWFHGSKVRFPELLEGFHNNQQHNEDHQHGWNLVYDPEEALGFTVFTAFEIAAPLGEHAMETGQNYDEEQLQVKPRL